MQQKIKIVNLPLFIDTLSTLSNYSEACKLDFVGGKNLNVYLRNAISRIHIETSSCVPAPEISCSISIDKLNTLICPLKSVIKKQTPEIELELIFENNRISYSGTFVSFSIIGVKEEIIASSIDKPIQIELQTACNFTADQRNLLEILGNASTVVGGQNIGFKLVQDPIKQKMIYIEAFSRSSTLSNKFRQHFANINSGSLAAGINIDEARLLLAKYLDSETIDFSFTTNNVLIMQAEKTEKDFFSRFIVYTSILKEDS